MRTSLFNFSSQTASNDDVEAQSTDISVIGGSKSAVNSKSCFSYRFCSRFCRASVVISERISLSVVRGKNQSERMNITQGTNKNSK